VSREELAARAQSLVNTGEAPGGTVEGLQVVVIVMDETMEFVGVGSNLVEGNLKAVLWCALNGEDRVDHKAQ
jgi:hypothetical protein